MLLGLSCYFCSAETRKAINNHMGQGICMMSCSTTIELKPMELQKSKEYKAAQDLATALNDYGWDSNRFAESTKYYHRTIQQTLMRSIVAIIKMVGSNTYDYDLRNNSSHELCKRIVESGLLDEVSLPMV